MIPAKYPKTQIKKCTECSLTHFVGLNCKSITCLYCDSTHNIKQYRDGLCPVMHFQTFEVRQKKMIACTDCRGLGTYKKIEHVTLEEDQAAYDQRIADWTKYIKKSPYEEKPEKMIFRTSTVETKVACGTCDQQGLVKRVKFCCFSGCLFCNYQGVIQNDAWRRLKMEQKKKDTPASSSSLCSICLEMVIANSPTYPLDCKHIFHKKCILQHFGKQGPIKTCPNCRSNEPLYPYLSDEALKKSRPPPPKYPSTVKILNQDTVLTKYRSRSRDQIAQRRRARSPSYSGSVKRQKVEKKSRPISPSRSNSPPHRNFARRSPVSKDSIRRNKYEHIQVCSNSSKPNSRRKDSYEEYRRGVMKNPLYDRSIQSKRQDNQKQKGNSERSF